jgi:ArsR family transcriptional regulator, arsenate/arsenite/antimonite-responsive transcriptional repressor
VLRVRGADAEPDARPDDADAELALLCKALGHPARVAILRKLAAAGTCFFGDVAAITGLAPSTAAQHVTQLKAAGLIRQWDDGRRSCYCVDRAQLRALTSLFGGLETACRR